MIVDGDTSVAGRQIQPVECGTPVGERTGTEIAAGDDGGVEDHERGRTSRSDRRRVP